MIQRTRSGRFRALGPNVREAGSIMPWCEWAELQRDSAFLHAEGVKVCEGPRGSDRDAGRTGDSRAPVAAIAVRVLGEVLLVVVLGVVERSGVEYFRGDAAITCR